MPLTMIVFCSWVTFFLIKTEKGGEVPARTALGANSILSIVNVGFGGKSRHTHTDTVCQKSRRIGYVIPCYKLQRDHATYHSTFLTYLY